MANKQKTTEEKIEEAIPTIEVPEKSTEIQTSQPQQAMAMPGQPDQTMILIQQAIMQNTPVETMERLLAMKEKIDAKKAKEAFDKAMAEFQADCPVIEKRKKVYEKNSTTKVRYSFAPIEDIIEQVKEPMGRHGLSYAFKTIQTQGEFGIICIAKHIMGHSEETSFVVPIGTEDFMSNVQKFGARNTFCKRYAFCNAFGISTGDEDTDATEKEETVASEDPISPEDAQAINNTKTQEELQTLCAELKKKYVKPVELKALIILYNEKKKIFDKAFVDEVADGIEKQGKEHDDAK